MHAYREADKTPTRDVGALRESIVLVQIDDKHCVLDDGSTATRAMSCLIEMQVGDRVLTLLTSAGDCFVLHVLARQQIDSVTVSAPGADLLRIQQAAVVLASTGRIALHALKDVEINACGGALRVTARDMFQNVSGAFVENVRQYVGEAEHYLLEVKQLLRQHGQHVMVTAESDVKVDAERISMG
jgi:hypothetical protein